MKLTKQMIDYIGAYAQPMYAAAEGRAIQKRNTEVEDAEWEDTEEFALDFAYEWRITPGVCVRTAVIRDNYGMLFTRTANTPDDVARIEKERGFVKWLDEWRFIKVED